MGPTDLLIRYGTEFLGTIPMTSTPLDEKIRDYSPGERMHTLFAHSKSIPEYVIERLASEFEQEKNIFLYVHQNAYRPDSPHPVLCILYVHKDVLVIGRKFKRGNLQTSKARDLFLKLLYSEENQKRLKKYQLSIHATIEEYENYW